MVPVELDSSDSRVRPDEMNRLAIGCYTQQAIKAGFLLSLVNQLEW